MSKSSTSRGTRSMPDSVSATPVSGARPLEHDVSAEARLALIDQPHVARLTLYAKALSARTSPVPFFDPLDGGCEAKILLLLESPASYSAYPRFVSLDNPVPTQRNLRKYLARAGLARTTVALWNIFPWLARSHESGARSLRVSETRQGFAELLRLLPLFDKLKVIVLAGRTAQKMSTSLRETCPECAVLDMPHPSPLSVCSSRAAEQTIVSVLAQARDIAIDRHSALGQTPL